MTDIPAETIAKAARWLTLWCLFTLCIGGGVAWVMVRGGGPEALGAIIPMLIVGGVHLLLGPLAVYYAGNPAADRARAVIYGYFSGYILLAFWLVGPEAVFYYFLYLVLMAVALLPGRRARWREPRGTYHD